MPRFTASFIRTLLAASMLAGIGAALLGSGPSSVADAAVRHAVGFRATVDGWTSWYGSYDLGAVGRSFCVDHGSSAPDVDHRYVRSHLGLDAPTTTALAWLYGMNQRRADTDPVAAAALMLAGHDIRGARYPYGRLDVDRLTTARLAGFGGREVAVIAKARAMKADAIAHSSLVEPLSLTIDPARSDSSDRIARLVDAAAQPVAGIEVRVVAGPSQQPITTNRDGIVVVASEPTTGLGLEAGVPSLQLVSFIPTKRRAQRVARGEMVRLRAEAPPAVAPPAPPSTTTTEAPTTTTTEIPTTTTTTAVPVTTTEPPATATSTTAAPTTTTEAPVLTTSTSQAPAPSSTSTSTSTTAAATPTTTPASPPPRVSAPPPTTPPSTPPSHSPPRRVVGAGAGPPSRSSLPRTGFPAAEAAGLGVGLLFAGSGLILAAQTPNRRRRPPRLAGPGEPPRTPRE